MGTVARHRRLNGRKVGEREIGVVGVILTSEFRQSKKRRVPEGDL